MDRGRNDLRRYYDSTAAFFTGLGEDELWKNDLRRHLYDKEVVR